MADAERIPTRISTAELERRWSAVRAAMDDRHIDALVMQAANDWLGGTLKWFTDIPAHNGYPRTVIFHASEPMTVIEHGPRDGVRRLHGADEVHRGVAELLTVPAFASIAYTHAQDAALAAAVLKRRGYRRIGLVGPGALPHALVDTLGSALEGRAVLVDATDLVDGLKAVKSTEEVALIRATAHMQDDVLAAVLVQVTPGMCDMEIAALAQHEGQVRGSEQGIFLGGSAPLGQRASLLGRHFQGRRIGAGDHISLLIENNGPGGLYTEIARTIVFGTAPAELKEAFERVKTAQAHTLALLRPGASCRDIFAAHNDFMRANGLPEETRLYAHGQGYDMVERPLIRDDEPMSLAAGMCLAVHPGYETPSLFAVICDNYLVEESGASACLHRTAKQIFEV